MQSPTTIRVTGRLLNERWGVKAEHALYREDGEWYHQLVRFPGALFDRNGYVLFETHQAFTADPHLRIASDVHVPGGIAAMPNYVRVYEAPMPPDNELVNGPVRRRVEVNRIVRDTPLSRRVKALHGYQCQFCYATVRISSDRLYAEGHHLQPLGAPDNGPDVAENIVCVCPTCHVLLDYGAIEVDLHSLRRVNGHRVGIQYIQYHNHHRFAGTPE